MTNKKPIPLLPIPSVIKNLKAARPQQVPVKWDAYVKASIKHINLARL